MAFPPAREPTTHADFLDRLPPGLRTFIDGELAAGNRIAETGTGFPAAPVGVWIVLAEAFRTPVERLPQDVVYRVRPHWTWPAECTDPARHFFVLPAPGSSPPPPPRPLGPTGEVAAPAARAAGPIRQGEPSAATFGYADEFDRAGLERRVSAAIAHRLGLMWNEETEAAIRADVGEDGLALVKEIDAFANRPEFWQSAPSTDRAHDRVQRDLKNKYPFLSAPAVQRLATRAAWGWR
jgi:hypothetical protein